MSHSSILNLPNEILDHIFKYCGFNDIIHLHRVCKLFHYLTRDLFDAREISYLLLIDYSFINVFHVECHSALLMIGHFDFDPRIIDDSSSYEEHCIYERKGKLNEIYPLLINGGHATINVNLDFGRDYLPIWKGFHNNRTLDKINEHPDFEIGELVPTRFEAGFSYQEERLHLILDKQTTFRKVKYCGDHDSDDYSPKRRRRNHRNI